MARSTAEAMRTAAAIIDELPDNVWVWPTHDGIAFFMSTHETEADDRKALLAETTRVIKAHVPGEKIEKKYEDGGIRMTASLGGGFKIVAVANSVCEIVSTGKKKTIKTRKLVSEAVYEDVEEEIEVFEWDCTTSILETTT